REMILTAEDASYTRYLDEKLNLTPEETHYSFEVTFPEDMTVDVKFQLGNIGDAASLPAHTVTLRQITWEELP
ncbi:MAG: hypothetical protein II916_09995, partial [Oscillospiraceae bacterium]|nr:hypothetical protein [Oscillospiraceae bacterium]